MRTNPGKKLWDETVDEISEYAGTHFGFYQRLTDELTKLSKKRGLLKASQRVWSRESVSRMFTKNADRRVEPLAGTGKLVEIAFENLKQQDEVQT